MKHVELVADDKKPNAASIERALELGDAAPSVRLQLTLKPEFARRLNEMKKKSRAASYSDVVRDALKLYEGVLTHLNGDGRLMIKKPDGTVVEFMIL
jgi:ATP-dependent exoDNAse (exonuclease V) beta subunit